MNKRYTMKALCLFIFVHITIAGFSQGLHFTQFNLSPMTLNPALTGAFEGTFRVGGIYRNQWASILGANAFSTPSFFVDAPIIQGLRKNDWVGVGVMLYKDQAGSVDLSNTTAMLSSAYHFSLTKSSQLTVGFQGGTVQRKLDVSKLLFEDGIRSGNPSGSMDMANVEPTSSYYDFNTGVMLSSVLDRKSDMTIGIAFNHITRPKYGLIKTSSKETLPMNTVFHGRLNYDLDRKWTVSPSFIFQSFSGWQELTVQALMGYVVNEIQDVTLRFGGGYRVGDSAHLMAGMDYGTVKVGLAYDINLSKLAKVTNTVGGFELGVAYIGKVYKKPVVKPSILCPRF
jgi:type IX secretion system PorP/SprF family membrane protein